MCAVSAKALCILLLSTLLRLQRDHHLYEIAQGVATLYPGLCTFALTARQLPSWNSELGYSIFAHQIVHPTYLLFCYYCSGNIKNRFSPECILFIPHSGKNRRVSWFLHLSFSTLQSSFRQRCWCLSVEWWGGVREHRRWLCVVWSAPCLPHFWCP